MWGLGLAGASGLCVQCIPAVRLVGMAVLLQIAHAPPTSCFQAILAVRHSSCEDPISHEAV